MLYVISLIYKKKKKTILKKSYLFLLKILHFVHLAIHYKNIFNSFTAFSITGF